MRNEQPIIANGKLWNPNTQRWIPLPEDDPPPQIESIESSRPIPTWRPIIRHQHFSGEGLPVDEFESFERETPIRESNIDSDVAVPFLQAAITGLFAWPVSLTVCHAANVETIYSTGVASAIALLTWRWTLIDSRRLLRILESVSGYDIDGDGVVGEPEPPQPTQPLQAHAQLIVETPPPPRKIELIVKTESPSGQISTRYHDLELSRTNEKALAVIAERLHDGEPFTRRAMCANNGISQGQFAQLAQKLREADLAELDGRSTILNEQGHLFITNFLDPDILEAAGELEPVAYLFDADDPTVEAAQRGVVSAEMSLQPARLRLVDSGKRLAWIDTIMQWNE